MVWNKHKMLYILPNVHQLIQITSLYYISGDPIIHNIAKIATIVLKMGCPKQIKLLQKGIFALVCGPWVLLMPKNWKQYIYFCILFNIWKHHFEVKITLRALLGVLGHLIFAPKLIIFGIVCYIMVWNGDKKIHIVPNIHQLMQIISLFFISSYQKSLILGPEWGVRDL